MEALIHLGLELSGQDPKKTKVAVVDVFKSKGGLLSQIKGSGVVVSVDLKVKGVLIDEGWSHRGTEDGDVYWRV